MAYDKHLAERIRERLSGHDGVTEKKLFGGLAFLINGNMAIAASGQGGIMFRADEDLSEILVASTPAYPAKMKGRPVSGWLRVDAEHLNTDNYLYKWITISTAYAESLPAK